MFIKFMLRLHTCVKRSKYYRVICVLHLRDYGSLVEAMLIQTRKQSSLSSLVHYFEFKSPCPLSVLPVVCLASNISCSVDQATWRLYYWSFLVWVLEADTYNSELYCRV